MIHDQPEDEQWLAELQEISSEIVLYQFLQRMTQQYGFAGYAIVNLPPASEKMLSKRVVTGTLPKQFMLDYDRLNLLKRSPVFGQFRQSTTPLVWDIDEGMARDKATRRDEVVRLFKHYGYRIAALFPVHSPDGQRAIIVLIGKRSKPSLHELADLCLLAVVAYDRLYQLRHAHQRREHRLSEREMQVLDWAANGKTSTEIGMILSLSDHTVNSYLNSAMRKMDCVNRTQLVAKAVRLNIIQ